MTTTEHHEKFSLLPFIYTNSLTLLIIFGSIKLLFPLVWSNQLSTSLSFFIFSFLVIHLAASFVEFFFHRYVLHMTVIPFFAHFHQQHNVHHDHTTITREGLYTRNVFPIVKESQFEASFFPGWTLLAFSVLLTPFFILVHIFFPSIPIFLAGYTALFFSMALYEMFHAAWHWPLSRWERLFKQKYLGRLWYTMYTFHLRHHANVQCNESVSGFFGIPIPDLVFNTYIRSGTLYPDKYIDDPREFTAPRPIFLIRWIDTFLISISKK